MTDRADRLDVTIDGESRELFMPFAMLSELTRLIPNVEGMGQLMIDPDLRDAALAIVLSERNAQGKIETPFDMAVSTMNTATANSILDWVMENVVDFFVQAMESSRRLIEKHQKTVQGSMSSPSGSPA